MLRGFANILPNESHPSDETAGIFIVDLAAKTNPSFDTIGINLQCFGGMATFACFGKLFEKKFAAAVSVDRYPRV